MNRYLLIFLFLISCSSNNDITQKNFQNLDFSNDLTFEEFKSNLKVYVDNIDYPNIDE